MVLDPMKGRVYRVGVYVTYSHSLEEVPIREEKHFRVDPELVELVEPAYLGTLLGNQVMDAVYKTHKEAIRRGWV